MNRIEAAVLAISLLATFAIALVPSCPWMPALMVRCSDHLIAALTWYGFFRGCVYVKLKPVVFHYDSPFALKCFLHSMFCNDLVRLHGHPVLYGVNFGVFETWATNMALNYFLFLDAEFADTACEGIELGFENHARLLVVVVLQSVKVIILLNIFHLSVILAPPLHPHHLILPILLLMLKVVVLLLTSLLL